MNANVIVWPVLAQILLTLMTLTVLGSRKAKAVRAREVDRRQAALDNRAWPESVVKVSNNLANQFEVPVLFYVMCLVLHSMDAVGPVALVLAWSFTLSRYAHTYVHIGSNHVPTRLRLFLLGCVVLIALLVNIAWKM